MFCIFKILTTHRKIKEYKINKKYNLEKNNKNFKKVLTNIKKCGIIPSELFQDYIFIFLYNK